MAARWRRLVVLYWLPRRAWRRREDLCSLYTELTSYLERTRRDPPPQGALELLGALTLELGLRPQRPVRLLLQQAQQ